MFQPGNPYLKGRLSMVDLLVPTSLHCFYIENIFYSFTKQASLMCRSTELSFPFQLVFPVATIVNKLQSFLFYGCAPLAQW